MKVKYYLRGIGVGIFVTAFIMSCIWGNKRQNISDEEIIRRAEKMGMVMRDDSIFTSQDKDFSSETEKTKQEYSSDKYSTIENNESVQNNSSAEKSTNASKDDNSIDQKSDSKSDSILNEEIDSSKKNSSSSINTENEDDQEIPDEVPKIQVKEYELNIEMGTSSDKVARILEDNEIIDDAVAFNQYLVKNEYHKKIKTGLFIVDDSMEYNQIADIITERIR